MGRPVLLETRMHATTFARAEKLASVPGVDATHLRPVIQKGKLEMRFTEAPPEAKQPKGTTIFALVEVLPNGTEIDLGGGMAPSATEACARILPHYERIKADRNI